MPECTAATITPESRLGDLLERWPGLEVVLIELSPHFRALSNPVLRRTVAKVATLRQVSTVSGVPLGTLIERLRAEAGLSPLAIGDEAAARPRNVPRGRWREQSCGLTMHAPRLRPESIPFRR